MPSWGHWDELQNQEELQESRSRESDVLLDKRFISLAAHTNYPEAQASPQTNHRKTLALDPGIHFWSSPGDFNVQPGLQTAIESLLICLSSLLLSAWFHSTESSSYYDLRHLSSPNDLNRKNKINKASFSQHSHVNGFILLGFRAHPFYSNHCCWRLGTNLPLWTGILIDNAPETSRMRQSNSLKDLRGLNRKNPSISSNN